MDICTTTAVTKSRYLSDGILAGARKIYLRSWPNCRTFVREIADIINTELNLVFVLIYDCKFFLTLKIVNDMLVVCAST